MLWMKKDQILFIHNPKCAGTAVHNAVLLSYPNAKKYWGRFYSSDLDRIIDLTHLTIQEAHQITGITSRCSSFGFVRNPFNRFVSAYWHLKVHNTSLDSMSMEELAFDILDEERIRYDWKFIHFIPQYRMFFINNTQAVSNIWKVESISSSWNEVCEVYRLSTKLEYENVRINCPTVDLSDRLKARLTFLYARDFKLFNYDPAPADDAMTYNTGQFYQEYASMWPERRSVDISDYYKR
jgi:hypothetical protein